MKPTPDDNAVRKVLDRLWPVLRTLADSPAALHRRDIFDRVADALGLDQATREERIPSGKVTRHVHRTGWALQHLKHAGLVRAEGRGTWGLTAEGRAFVAARPGGPSPSDISVLMKATGARSFDHDDGPAPRDGATPASPPATASLGPDDTTPPDEQIEHALALLRQSVVEQLLERLMAGTPAFFEFVVADLLRKMGYGTSRDDLRRVVGSGDGGIDGIMSLDRLGLEKVYIQAKRWQNNVGRPEIQGFFGALHGRKANKGVFITTSRFTREAHDFATSVSDTIVLIDGQALALLMVELGVGVTLRPVYLPDIDSDYFLDE